MVIHQIGQREFGSTISPIRLCTHLIASFVTKATLWTSQSCEDDTQCESEHTRRKSQFLTCPSTRPIDSGLPEALGATVNRLRIASSTKPIDSGHQRSPVLMSTDEIQT